MTAIARGSRLFATLVNPLKHVGTALEAVRFLRSCRVLVLEMAKRELVSRHAGQHLGTLWAVAHPLFQMGLMVFIFGVVFRQRIGGTFELPLDYTVYILCGLAAWLSISPALTSTASSLTGNAALLKQFSFDPRLLPVKDVLVNSLIWLISVAVVMLYTLVRYRAWPVTYLLIPVVAVLHFMTVLGFAWLLSAVVVFFRDLKEFVVLGVTVMVYLLPVVYLPAWVPPAFRPVIFANPFSYLIWVYQDVFYFGRFEHPAAWVVAPLFALVSFSLGYRVFRRLEPMFGRAL